MPTGTTGTAAIPLPRDPMHDRPDFNAESLRHDLQTLHGIMQHYAHVADDLAVHADCHSRDVQRGKSAAYIHAAREIAHLLWPGE